MTRVLRGNVLAFCKHYHGEKFHGVLCDPPYELGFMGKSWDRSGVAFQPETWAAIGSLLLPGAHLMAFGGCRTHHRMMCAIEDAGFEIRDVLMYIFGAGFPKGHKPSHDFERTLCEKRNEKWFYKSDNASMRTSGPYRHPLANEWDGWDVALKPAFEPVILARWPLEGTVAANCLKHGAGALNVDGCRIGTGDSLNGGSTVGAHGAHEGWRRPWMENPETNKAASERAKARVAHAESLGRWPANVIHDGSEEVLKGFPVTESGAEPRRAFHNGREASRCKGAEYRHETLSTFGDAGSAARYFYCAKASKEERDAGLAGWEEHTGAELTGRKPNSKGLVGTPENRGQTANPYANGAPKVRNHHPTVKPIALTEYLARLILPPVHPSRIFVPFTGSGSEMIGAHEAGWDVIIGVELMEDYVNIAKARLKYWTAQQRMALEVT